MYIASAISLFILIVAIPRMWRQFWSWFYNTIHAVNRHSFGRRFLNDITFRGQVSLYHGFFINLLFAAFKLIMSLTYKSVWFGAVAIYYIVLCIIRFILIRSFLRIKNYCDNSERKKQELKSYRLCGYLMFTLNIAMMGMTIQMIWQNKGYSYSGVIIYISALYAFYCFTMAIINLVKSRNLHSPIISATKVLSFTGALMSIYNLQTAMLERFNEGDNGFRQIMNALVGGGVCLIVFVMAIFMVVRGTHELARQIDSDY
jgi:hypothetical protein